MNRRIETAERCDLVNGISKTHDVSAQHPEMVKQLVAVAEMARADLGDTLSKRPGPGRREPGRRNEGSTKIEP